MTESEMDGLTWKQAEAFVAEDTLELASWRGVCCAAASPADALRRFLGFDTEPVQ